MIDFYTFTTPNGYKPAILLEELGLPYAIHKIHIGKGDQFKPEFVAINPNSKIPAIIDRDTTTGEDITIFESGAILIYLAEKTGKLLPADPAQRAKVIEWLMFQMGGVGPMFGQLGHFRNSAPEQLPYAIGRYDKETKRLLSVLDRQLAETPYLAGEYSIADIATYPWVAAANTPYLSVNLDEFPNVQRWVADLAARRAVKTGTSILTPEFTSEYGTVA